MMAPQRKRQPYPRSRGNLALAVERAEFISRVRPPHSPVLRTVTGTDADNSMSDALAPATGLLVGGGLSVLLWSGIAFLIFWSH